jgi:hypothetical protein
VCWAGGDRAGGQPAPIRDEKEQAMQENVGTTDRLLRSFAGPALLAYGIARLGGIRREPYGIAALVGGALILESAITRVCPLNALLGIDTRR